MRTKPRTRSRAALLAVTSLLVVALLGACTGDEAEDEQTTPPPPTPTTESGAPRLVVEEGPMRARVVRVGGELTAKERPQVRDNIARVVGRWFDAAYLRGDLPDADLGQAFEVFTPAAARQAAGQADVTTGRVLGAELTQVVPTVRRLEAAVFAPDRGPAGATAQVTLVFVGADEGDSQVEQVVRGELFLTSTADGWRVFGFELQRSVGAVGTFEERGGDGSPGRVGGKG